MGSASSRPWKLLRPHSGCLHVLVPHQFWHASTQRTISRGSDRAGLRALGKRDDVEDSSGSILYIYIYVYSLCGVFQPEFLMPNTE